MTAPPPPIVRPKRFDFDVFSNFRIKSVSVEEKYDGMST